MYSLYITAILTRSLRIEIFVEETKIICAVKFDY